MFVFVFVYVYVYVYVCVHVYVYMCICICICMCMCTCMCMCMGMCISQIARGVPLRVYTESSPQISNRKGCLPKIFQRIISPNFKSQGVSP